MTPGEKQMIQDFFGRLAAQGEPEKDRAAEALIGQEMRRDPDAAYRLVQTALVYEHQMGALEDRVRDLQQQLEAQASGTSGGSFLGGRLGQGGAAQGGSAGYARVRPGALSEAQDEPLRAAARSPWPQPAPVEPAQAQRQGGGFFRSAMATAAGVAGGMMLGDGLRGLFGGEAHSAGVQDSGKALTDADRTQDELQDEVAQRDAELAAQDSGDDAAQDAGYGDSGDDSLDI